MQLSKNDEYLIKRIEDADDRERELFKVIREFGLTPDAVAQIQDELRERGITRNALEPKASNPGDG